MHLRAQGLTFAPYVRDPHCTMKRRTALRHLALGASSTALPALPITREYLNVVKCAGGNAKPVASGFVTLSMLTAGGRVRH